MPPKELIVKVVGGLYPRALTCFETIKLPQHYVSYTDFESDLTAAIATCHAGFGLASASAHSVVLHSFCSNVMLKTRKDTLLFSNDSLKC